MRRNNADRFRVQPPSGHSTQRFSHVAPSPLLVLMNCVFVCFSCVVTISLDMLTKRSMTQSLDVFSLVEQTLRLWIEFAHQNITCNYAHYVSTVMRLNRCLRDAVKAMCFVRPKIKSVQIVKNDELVKKMHQKLSPAKPVTGFLQLVEVEVSFASRTETYPFFMNFHYAWQTGRLLSYVDTLNILRFSKFNHKDTLCILLRTCLHELKFTAHLEHCAPFFIDDLYDLIANCCTQKLSFNTASCMHLQKQMTTLPYMTFNALELNLSRMRNDTPLITSAVNLSFGCSILKMNDAAAKFLLPYRYNFPNVTNVHLTLPNARIFLISMPSVEYVTIVGNNGDTFLPFFNIFDTLRNIKMSKLKDLTIDTTTPKGIAFTTPTRRLPELIRSLSRATPYLQVLRLHTESCCEIVTLADIWHKAKDPPLPFLREVHFQFFDMQTCTLLIRSDVSELLTQLEVLSWKCQPYRTGVLQLCRNTIDDVAELLKMRFPTLHIAFLHDSLDREVEDVDDDEGNDADRVDFEERPWDFCWNNELQFVRYINDAFAYWSKRLPPS